MIEVLPFVEHSQDKQSEYYQYHFVGFSSKEALPS